MYTGTKVLLGLCFVAISIAGCGVTNPPTTEVTPVSENAEPVSNPFRDAVNKAIEASELTQTASLSEEWKTIVATWQQAIDLMKAVPESDSNYATAQQKIIEYQSNLEYASSQQARLAALEPPQQISQSGGGLGDHYSVFINKYGNITSPEWTYPDLVQFQDGRFFAGFWYASNRALHVGTSFDAVPGQSESKDVALALVSTLIPSDSRLLNPEPEVENTGALIEEYYWYESKLLGDALADRYSTLSDPNPGRFFVVLSAKPESPNRIVLISIFASSTR